MPLEVRGLTADIGAVRILQGLDLDVAEGEAVALIGSNGAGKSTLMRSVAGLLRPIGGSVRYGGADLGRLSADKVVRLGLALVPEGRQIFAPLTVRENLLMGAYAKREGPRELERVLAVFPKLAARLQQLGGTLSGGEQQMLAIGRALMSAPRLLLLDEPSLGLAPKVVAEIFEVIGQLVASGTSVLLAEQNAAMALRVAGRGYVLRAGNIVLSGSARALADDPSVQQAYLGI
ncbi:ABC transporter ATP-binding protein [Achromobacter marplatensis]|uniref:Amino acid/amide ABC transporter ATP-binding protein 2 (HAAT family) n=1 Tax=Achromobacter marplatensis TaxID=470868 RepID=A0ABX9GM66_9BURK|nr:ABC transporter ATP-binding protein [Achromobacter marplatensis]OWT72493.1 ABC transporter ATP-binding protein [Achromobacter marplatensis]RBP24204.1 amino acid/amide ABC transporter ATP-binding protein 2 (HAAT family) [Achromobacter marplatensis]CAB3627785.1 High-affinity branched-chain amino acid transport ATP-binding protein LivF [Achromobacter marplatensis]